MARSSVSFLKAFALLLALSAAWGASAAERTTIGVLPFTSSGPVFLALENGRFKAEGIEAELVFFQAAPPIAQATATGQTNFGVTALTAAVYNLAAEGRLKIVAGQALERKGHPGNLILVSREAQARGADSLDELLREPFGLTQLGSPSHYQLGQLAASRGIPARDLDVRAFQTLPNLVAALKSGAVSWAIIAPPIATDLIAAGSVVSFGPFSDHGTFQFGAAFVSGQIADKNPDLVRRFLRAYRQGLADYAAIIAEPSSEEARRAARTVGRFVYADMEPDKAAELVLHSAFYVDPTGAIDIEDVQRQIEWYHDNGMVAAAIDARDILLPATAP